MRGPRADAPEQALAGFARKHGLDPARLEHRDGFVWAVSQGAATPVAELVPDLVRALVEGIQFSKSMRWEGGRFSRPIRWLVVKLDDRIVPMRLAGVASGGTTSGHRYEGGHGPIGTAASYLDDLRGLRVMAEASERRAAIVAGLDAAGPWADPGAKLDEVVYLVEWPVVLEGRFDRAYLELPDRVVVTAMQSHQRYFPVRREGAALEPRFVFVANGGDPDVGAGRERGGAGRTARRRPVRVPARPRARDRRDGGGARPRQLPGRGRIARRQGGAARCRSSAGCARGTGSGPTSRPPPSGPRPVQGRLVSGLVSEFADLEGYAGSVYARAAGEDEAVCIAIEEHHRPQRGGRDVAGAEAGAVLALADKADTVAVAFARGLEPTGSRDPYGLRRAAAGIVAIALDRGIPHRPRGPGRCRRRRIPARPAGAGPARGGRERRGAARGARPGAVEPVEVAGRARALHAFAGSGARRRCATRTTAACASPARPRRARSTRRSSRTQPSGSWPPPRRTAREPGGCGRLRPAVNRFFEDVLVMAAERRRANRLTLVANVAAGLRTLADFGQLPG